MVTVVNLFTITYYYFATYLNGILDRNVTNSETSSISAMTIKDTMMPVISSYHGATTFGQTSPGNASRPYQTAASPGPSGQDVYNQSPEQSYVQATSPQPSGFQALAINRVSKY